MGGAKEGERQDGPELVTVEYKDERSRRRQAASGKTGLWLHRR